MAPDYLSLPIDATSAAALAERGLRMDLLDTTDLPAFAAWVQADMRGFHEPRIDDDYVTQFMDGVAYRRTTGVWDDTAVDPVTPVGAANSWTAELTVPGGRVIPAWAISFVSVAPTHRRNGIARALLEAELRTAATLGVPLAMLTVSESTIYGRFGFAPAAMAAEWRIDTRRAVWTGPVAPGRLHFLEVPQFRSEVEQMYERVRIASPGQLKVWGLRWDQLVGTAGTNKDRIKQLRAVRYDDPDGTPRGLALYRISGGESDFSAHTLDVEYLISETPDAYAGLWRFLLEVDLVTEVRAQLRSVDEPVRWQISDFRAAKVSPGDHLWVRVIDVAASLEGRSYAAPARLVLEVSDSLGFATGRYLVDISDGAATVTGTDAAADLAMSVNELSALYLGGVAASTLVAAGLITELRPNAATELDTAFRSPVTPWLSVWF
jgi:predicted acetyltransferase